MSAFRVTAVTPIRKERLLAEVALEMPSGLIVHCLVTRNKDNAKEVDVFPAGRKTPTGWAPVVEFASADRRAAWTKSAQQALVPHIAELLGENCQEVTNAEF